ncbi:hypothetical protein PBI_SARFIRE_89 [Mycobacterium phage SarFire]|uniref:hypothetical protein n=1 Tax=Mycobacterium phage SarFire TaxID=1340827 RepID=UPI000389874A|nr:hypothetical protein P765_gp89 [Mycobacterium phage SarFire]AGT20620.1 hypothetical protein PBI_SARFIRE_89 [Mycobacterium phage SarFire]AJA43664.1 hypothetical protein PBI_THOR_89 [Mycobacterium phage Thor]
MREALQNHSIDKVMAGDHMVVPFSTDMYGLPAVYGEDKQGFVTLRVDAGTRYEVVSNDGETLTARDVTSGRVVSQRIPAYASVLKVVQR